jgi:TPR repeat protein
MRDEVKVSSKAVLWLTCVALIGAATIALHIYKARAHARKLAEDAAVYRARAVHGDAKAEYELGSIYYHGSGVPQDYAEAARWYEEASENGNAEAQYAIGYMHYHGQGVSQDYGKALLWFRKAANQGNTQSEYEIGYMYYRGNGVPRDYVEAARWFHEAADQGNAKAQDQFGYMYYRGDGVPLDYAEAARWFRKAAHQGNAGAQYDLGCVYERGEGVAQDYTEATRWFRKAADQGDERAQFALGLETQPSTFRKIYLSLGVLGSVLLWVDALSPWLITRRRQPRATALTGVLGLLWVGLNLYGGAHFGIVESGPMVHAFYLVRDLIGGSFAAMLIFLLLILRARIVLQISGALFIGFNTYALTLYQPRSSAPAINAFWSANGWLIGMAIPAAIYLWLEHKGRRDSANRPY